MQLKWRSLDTHLCRSCTSQQRNLFSYTSS